MASNIILFSDFADLVIYDSSDGYKELGINSQVIVKQKKIRKKTIENELVSIRDEINFSARIFDITENMRSLLDTRSESKQTFFITGQQTLLKVSDIRFIYDLIHIYDGKNPSYFKLDGGINKAENLKHFINLLGTDGDFETSAGGVGQGWTEYLLDDFSIETSPVDSGHAQYIGFNNVDPAYFARGGVVCPFYTSRRITFSAMVKNESTTIPATFRMFFFCYYLDDTYISFYKEITLGAGELKHVNISEIVNPERLIYKINVYFDNTANRNEIGLLIDKAQLEIGQVSEFKTY